MPSENSLDYENTGGVTRGFGEINMIWNSSIKIHMTVLRHYSLLEFHQNCNFDKRRFGNNEDYHGYSFRE